jgi:hypothetical protein
MYVCVFRPSSGGSWAARRQTPAVRACCGADPVWLTEPQPARRGVTV